MSVRAALCAIAALILSIATGLIAAETAGTAPRPAYDTQPAGAPLVPADEAAKRFQVPEGFHVSVFAAEPDVRQPIGFTTDARGRLWVAENDTYAEREVNFAADQRDRVVVFDLPEDGRGRSPKRTVFYDQAQKLTSVEVGFGGVWLMCPPQLLFIPDRNGDDVPDGPPQVVLDGFNADSIRHNLANGLRWGPDGWLYGRHGIQATSLVGQPGLPPSQRTAINCCLWRYHPILRTFEVVTTGGTNPWGFDYDEHGEMFLINTVIGHLLHAVPGAHYERMYGADLNPHVYELLDQTADHYHFDKSEVWSDAKQGLSDATSRAGGGHAHCGLLIYQGDNWPAEYRGRAYTVNLHGLRINSDLLQRRGCGYVGTHGPDLFQTKDPWFRGIELISGADGGVYVADWCDIGECHENDGVHRNSGRIYKIAYGAAQPAPALNLTKLSNAALVELLKHPNDWHVRYARQVLRERAVAGRDMSDTHKSLERMFAESQSPRDRLQALWALYGAGGVDRQDNTFLRGALKDSDEHVRCWAIRLLCDFAPPSKGALADFARLAESDPSGLVRLYLASALQRLDAADRWPIAGALAAHSEDAEDAMQPLMLWYGIEFAVPQNVPAAVELAANSRIPTVRRHLARRLTALLVESPEELGPVVAKLLAPERSAPALLDVLGGMSDALDGWRQAPAPANWELTAASLQKHANSDVQQAARDLAVVFGDGRALDSVRAVVLDKDADPQARRQALRVLVDARADGLGGQLIKLINDRVLVNEAVRGLAFFNEPATPSALIDRYSALDAPGRVLALDTLSSRPAFAKPLLIAIERRRIPGADLTAQQARQIFDLGDEPLRSDLKRLWGEARPPSAEKRRQMDELKQLLAPAALAKASLEPGRALFTQKCANCHTLFGQGGKIGPDLTGANRNNLEYLLENIIDPSATVAADFRTSVLLLADGRVLTGVILRRDDRTLELQTATEKLALPVSDVEEITAQNLSLMPEGLLTGLTPEQIRDLFGYVSSRR